MATLNVASAGIQISAYGATSILRAITGPSEGLLLLLLKTHFLRTPKHMLHREKLMHYKDDPAAKAWLLEGRCNRKSAT